MRRFLLILFAAVPLLLATGANASGPAVHFTEDPTGDVFVCEDATYTVTGGEIAITFHEGESASGNLNFTGTIVPRKVTAVDDEGNEFRAVGATWFGGTFNAQRGSFQGTFTFKIQLVSVGGGTADSVNLVAHESTDGANFFFDFGTCAAP
jgi:hypothetical protein